MQFLLTLCVAESLSDAVDEQRPTLKCFLIHVEAAWPIDASNDMPITLRNLPMPTPAESITCQYKSWQVLPSFAIKCQQVLWIYPVSMGKDELAVSASLARMWQC